MTKTFVHLGLGWIYDRGGGLERYQHGICTAHSKMGCNVSAWVQSRSAISSGNNYDIQAYASPTDSRPLKLANLKKIAKTRFKQTDFTFVSHHASVSRSVLPLIKHRVPHVVHFQGPWADEAALEGAPWWKTMVQRWDEKKVYRSADLIITLSHAFKELVVQRYGVDSERVRVVPGAIDFEASTVPVTRAEARQRLGWPLDRPIALAVRRLVRRVGVDVLVDAVAKLVNEQPDSDLLVMIGGTGSLENELRAKIKSMNIENHVRLLGFIPDDQLSLSYRAADVSVVPTQALEGFGLVTLESLAAGTPAMVTPIGSLPEVMTDLDQSLVLPGASVEDLCLGLKLFATGRSSLPDESMCKNYVRSRYDWGVIAPQVLALYNHAGS